MNEFLLAHKAIAAKADVTSLYTAVIADGLK